MNMQTMDIHQANGHLTEIINGMLPGEELVLTKDDQPIALIRATPRVRRAPQFGTMKGSITYIAPDFDDIPEGFEEYLP
jgi:antitoxin (DNA-binding transcriptional repressor) of toxin-antitoxin stability system